MAHYLSLCYVIPGIPWCPRSVLQFWFPAFHVYLFIGLLLFWREAHSLIEAFLWFSMPAEAFFYPHTWLLVGLCIAFYVDHFLSEPCRHLSVGLFPVLLLWCPEPSDTCSFMRYLGWVLFLFFVPDLRAAYRTSCCPSGFWGFTVRSLGYDLIFISNAGHLVDPFILVTDHLQF